MVKVVKTILVTTLQKNIYNVSWRPNNCYVIGQVHYNQQGRKNAHHVHHIAVQCFRLLLILPADLIVIFLRIKLSIVDANVSNGHELLEVAYMNVSPRIPSFKSNSVIEAADCFLDCAQLEHRLVGAPALVNRLHRGNVASISSN